MAASNLRVAQDILVRNLGTEKLASDEMVGIRQGQRAKPRFFVSHIDAEEKRLDRIHFRCGVSQALIECG